jgi:isocitrate lyase
VKHQRFVGTGYFDAVQNVISSGTASTTALAGSTEAEQFHEMPLPPPALQPQQASAAGND